MVHQLWAKDDLYERSFHLGGSKPLRVEELEEKQGKALFQEKKAIGREEPTQQHQTQPSRAGRAPGRHT